MASPDHHLVTVLPGRVKAITTTLGVVNEYESGGHGTRIKHNEEDICIDLKTMLPVDSSLLSLLTDGNLFVTLKKIKSLLDELVHVDFMKAQNRFLLWLALRWAKQWVIEHCKNSMVSILSFTQINEVLFAIIPSSTLPSDIESQNAVKSSLELADVRFNAL